MKSNYNNNDIPVSSGGRNRNARHIISMKSEGGTRKEYVVTS